MSQSDYKTLITLLDSLRRQMGLQHTSLAVPQRIADIELLLDKLSAKGQRHKAAEALHAAAQKEVPITAIGATQADAAANLENMPDKPNPEAQAAWERAIAGFKDRLRHPRPVPSQSLLQKLLQRRFLIGAGVALVVIILLVVALSGRTPSNDTKRQATTKTGQQAAQKGPDFKGIIVGSPKQVRYDGALYDQWTLTAYQPGKGEVASRVFNASGYEPAFAWHNTDELPVDSLIARQLFSAGYDKMAVYQRQSDGGRHVGYIDERGTFTNLTPQTSDYGGVQRHTEAIFHPVTGRIWFNTPTKLGSVDPNKGASSSQTEPFDVRSQKVSWSDTLATYSFYFSPSGDGPLYNEGPLYARGVYAPDGKTQLKAKTDVHGGVSCRPLRFIDNSAYLCLSSDKTKLYKVVPGGAATSLLPDSEREISDAIADPAGRQLAFIAKAGSVPTLYTVTISGGQPQKVADVVKGAALLSWEQ